MPQGHFALAALPASGPFIEQKKAAALGGAPFAAWATTPLSERFFVLCRFTLKWMMKTAALDFDSQA